MTIVGVARSFFSNLSRSGYNLSRSAKPGASGIVPCISSQFFSISDFEIGVVRLATAPEEYAASSALFFLVLLDTNTILAFLPLSLIYNEAMCPSKVGK